MDKLPTWEEIDRELVRGYLNDTGGEIEDFPALERFIHRNEPDELEQAGKEFRADLLEAINEETEAAVKLSMGKGVIGEILKERPRQDEKWGGPEHDDQHTPMEWLGFIAARTVFYGAGKYRRYLIEIAALCIAAAESFDRLKLREIEHD